MVNRLGNITTFGNFLLRPGSETSLPPISKVHRTPNVRVVTMLLFFNIHGSSINLM
jgi:hypothetical protein